MGKSRGSSSRYKYRKQEESDEESKPKLGRWMLMPEHDMPWLMVFRLVACFP